MACMQSVMCANGLDGSTLLRFKQVECDSVLHNDNLQCQNNLHWDNCLSFIYLFSLSHCCVEPFFVVVVVGCSVRFGGVCAPPFVPDDRKLKQMEHILTDLTDYRTCTAPMDWLQPMATASDTKSDDFLRLF